MHSVKLTAELCLLVLVAGCGAVDLGYRVGDLTIDALPFPDAVDGGITIRTAVGGVHALAIIGLLIVVAVTARTRLDRGRGNVKIAALMFLVTNGARDARLLMRPCI